MRRPGALHIVQPAKEVGEAAHGLLRLREALPREAQLLSVVDGEKQVAQGRPAMALLEDVVHA